MEEETSPNGLLERFENIMREINSFKPRLTRRYLYPIISEYTIFFLLLLEDVLGYKVEDMVKTLQDVSNKYVQYSNKKVVSLEEYLHDLLTDNKRRNIGVKLSLHRLLLLAHVLTELSKKQIISVHHPPLNELIDNRVAYYLLTHPSLVAQLSPTSHEKMLAHVKSVNNTLRQEIEERLRALGYNAEIKMLTLAHLKNIFKEWKSMRRGKLLKNVGA